MIDATSKGIMINTSLYDIVCWGTCVKKRAQKTGDLGSWSGVLTLACWVNLSQLVKGLGIGLAAWHGIYQTHQSIRCLVVWNIFYIGNNPPN